MAIDKRSIKEIFPKLYKELESSDNKISIDALRKDPIAAEEEVSGEEYTECECEEETIAPAADMADKLRHFNPTAVDFIRRCDTEVQAKEIIDYLEKKGEITKEYADELRCKMKAEGVRCFGPKKEEYYYFKEGGLF